MKAFETRSRLICAAAMAVISLCWLTGERAHGQTTGGSIYGAVTDSTGGVIPQAQVIVTQIQTHETHTTKSDASGNYVFPLLAPGSYSVTAKAQGFASETQTDIRLSANQNVHVIFNLNVGAVTENVTVAAATTLIDTRESQLGSTIDQKRLEELPLNGRDAYDLVQLSPGVTNVNEGQNGNGGQIGDVVGMTFSTNGLRVYENSFYLDGANNTSFFRPGGNLPPNPDALLEFRVLSSNFDAEFGTTPGAVVNMITRSGTDSYHGLAYDYVRNNIFNDRNWFVRPNTPAVHLRQNQFGASAGGPIVRNRLFGFFSYQGLRISQFQNVNGGTAIVPTMAERSGDFSADAPASQPICGPKTYPCGGQSGVIPQQYLDPVALNIVQSLPLPTSNNSTTGGPAPQQSAAAPEIGDQYLGRADYQVNQKHKLSYMEFYESGNQPSPNSGGQNILGYAGDLIQDSQVNEVGTDTWTISPSMLNSLIVFYSGNHYQSADLFPGQRSLSSLGASIPDGGSPSTQPNVRVGGFFTIGNSGSAPNTYTFTALGASDTFHWVRGNHAYKFGASISRNKFFLNTVGQRAGIYTVGGTNFSKNPLADFMMGKAQAFLQNNGFKYNLHYWDPSLFVQDDWHVLPRLTLNLGVRWEVFQPFHGDNNMGSFNPYVQSTVIPTAPTGLAFAGDPGVPDGVLVTTYDKFAPRLGLAYDVFGNGRTSLRGGWGLFYSQVPGTFYSNIVSPLYAVNVSISNATSFVNPYTGSTTPVDPFPFTPNLKNPTFAAGLAFPAEPPSNKAIPYVMEYNLTVEHQISQNWAASVSYVANSARKLYAERDENAPIYSASCTSATCASASQQLARRPYKPTTTSYVFNQIYEYFPEGGSSYNSLQTSLTRRFAHNFSVNANYVWAKNLGDTPDPTPNGFSVLSGTDNYNLRADYGKTSYDQPQRFVVSYLWVSPEIHRWGYAGRAALSGWRINGITTLATGQPFNMVSGSDTNFDGTNNDRPNLVASPYLSNSRNRVQKIAEYFNPAAFAAVPAGTQTGSGNTQFNMMIGPGRKNTDLAASKSLPVWRESEIQFRAEAFNLFNNVNLGNPTAQLNSPNDGKITGAAAARILQLALKYSF